MSDYEVSGWRPDWRPAAEQVRLHGAELAALAGTRITGAWIVWIEEEDCWFPDLPVILEFDHARHLEICWQKFDDLSITWDSADLSVTPVAWVEWKLSWRAWGHDALLANQDSTVESIAYTEQLFESWPEGGSRRDAASSWLVGGLWFETSGPGLHVFDALDENGLETSYDPDLNRLHPLSAPPS